MGAILEDEDEKSETSPEHPEWDEGETAQSNLEEEQQEQEDEVEIPSRVRKSRSSSPPKQVSALLGSKARKYDLRVDTSQSTVRRKSRRKRRSAKGTRVKSQADLFPDWLVQLMFNIEEATTHELVIE